MTVESWSDALVIHAADFGSNSSLVDYPPKQAWHTEDEGFVPGAADDGEGPQPVIRELDVVVGPSAPQQALCKHHILRHVLCAVLKA